MPEKKTRTGSAAHRRAGTVSSEMDAPAEPRPVGYDPADYPPAAVTVDLVLLTVRGGRAETVLVRRDEDPYRGRWALPGGFVHPDEDLDAAVRRVFTAKTGLEVPYVEQLATYGAPNRDPRMRVVSVAYLVLLPVDAMPAFTATDDARFFALDELPAADETGARLAFDHDRILTDALERARAKLEYTTLAAGLLAEQFTLGELRRVYEAIWGVKLHPSNFNRKVTATDGFVVPLGIRLEARGAPEAFRRGPAELMMPPLMRPAAA